MAENLNKRPKKGILKNSSSFDTQELHPNSRNKETKWDEMNIIATLHPPDKDYGHMKIDEPKTPYNYDEPDSSSSNPLDADELAERIMKGADELPRALQEKDSEEDDDEEFEELTEEEKQQRVDFESKRKKHYNEFYSLKMARKLLEEDEDDENEDQEGAGGSSQTPAGSNSTADSNSTDTDNSLLNVAK